MNEKSEAKHFQTSSCKNILERPICAVVGSCQYTLLHSISGSFCLTSSTLYQSMALIRAFAHLSVVFFLACLAIACGTRLLRSMSLSVEGALEEALYSAGLFFAALEVVVFGLARFGLLRQNIVLGVLGAAAILAGKGWLRLAKLARAGVCHVRWASQSPLTLSVVTLVLICFGIDALMAMAPMTGSDAMHYHFTAPMLWAGRPTEPIFWLSYSFLVGQAHLLISLGMALGSDRISLGLIYLGGVLTAASLFVLTRKLVSSERWAWVTVLAFLLTPMVYWQMSISGSPDIWMAFYTTLVVLAAARGVETGNRHWWSVAGIFAGAVAGAKYTGWFVPVALVACCFLVLRSWKWTVLCGLWVLPTGILPLVRNALWTGDPFFPFLTRWLTPARVNTYALSAMVANTHPIGFDRSLLGITAYPLRLALEGREYGVGHYFGPLIIAFAPLLLLSVRKGFLAHIAAGMWAAVLLSNALVSQEARFLLPAFPIALALIFCGVAESFRRGCIVRVGCQGTLLLFLLFGLASEALYARDFIPVALGLERQDVFLERMAADYPTAAFVNRSLVGRGEVMVFFRHLYYLRPPFIEGRPEQSWLMDPDRLADSQKLLDFLHQKDVRWLVKAPDYPEPFARSFQALEDQGKLRQVYSADVSTFTGFRIYGQRVPVRVTILEVVPITY